MKHALMIGSSGQAFEMIKSMVQDNECWREEAHRNASRAYKAFLEPAIRRKSTRQITSR